MFATKKDATDWINEFSNGLQLEAVKYGKYWRIFDSDGCVLSEQRIGEIEDSVS